MKIETKYTIGQKAYAIEKSHNRNEYFIFESEIIEISYSADGIIYYLKNCGEDIKEENIIIDINDLGKKYLELKNKVLE